MENRDMSKLLRGVAMVVIGIGVICCLLNLTQFNDRNLGLMVGMGFLVGGGHIMLFGVIAALMQRNGPAPAVISSEQPA
jgi:formate hydrogenlyase subunit 3/multisubunit Na+/H+ antiporter MnhD subunit